METQSGSLPTLSELGYIEEPAAAELLKVKPVTLRNWRALGIGPPFTKVHGTRVVYPLAELRTWLQSRTVRPAGAPTLIDGTSKRRRGSAARDRANPSS